MNARALGLGVVLVAAAAGACGGAQGARGGGGARAPRALPSTRAVERAFERVDEAVVGCARADMFVTVRGTFEGATGGFTATSVQGTVAGQAMPAEVASCARRALEGVRVRPFTSARSPEYEHTYLSLSQAAGPAIGGSGDAGMSGSAGADGGSVRVTSGGETHGVAQGASASGPTPGQVVEREGDAFQRCYEREALTRDHAIEGTVTLRFTVRADGGVESVSTDVESTNADTTVMGAAARCMEQRVRGMRFVSPGQPGVEYRVPFRFVVGGAAEDPGE